MKQTPEYWFVSLMVLMSSLAGCGGGSSGGGGGATVVAIPIATATPLASPSASPNPTPATRFELRGAVTYDSVPPSDAGLDYAHIVHKAVRGAVTQLVDEQGDVVASTVTDNDGRYVFDFDAPTRVEVRVLAQTATPPMVVQDNSDGNAIYSMVSPLVDASKIRALNLDADAGGFVAGVGYTRTRVAAPFAALDTCYDAATKVLAVRPDITLPNLPINWSVNNVPGGQAGPNDADIGTSHYVDGSLFILGKENVDTDEYDVHVMVHEWGHFFEDKASRSDSIGGGHGTGDVLDPRIAFGEGYGNGLSGMINFPDFIYKDTGGQFQATLNVRLNLQDPGAGDPSPGWFSEASVQTILYRIFAPPNPPYNNLNLGLAPIIDVLVGPEKTTPAFTSIFTFINGLQMLGKASAAQIDPLLAAFKIAPITDDFGSGQTSDGGWDQNLPVYHDLPVDDNTWHAVTTRHTEGASFNRLENNRYFRFSGTGGTLDLRAVNAVGTRITVVLRGQQVAILQPRAADENVSFDTESGQVYVINVRQGVRNQTLTPALQLRGVRAQLRSAILSRLPMRGDPTPPY